MIVKLERTLSNKKLKQKTMNQQQQNLCKPLNEPFSYEKAHIHSVDQYKTHVVGIIRKHQSSYISPKFQTGVRKCQ